MGGYGSSRWLYHDKATPVEDCHVLDLRKLARDGAFVVGKAGTVRWFYGEKEVSSVAYVVFPRNDDSGRLFLLLCYKFVQSGDDIRLEIPLETTTPRFGGICWWGRCPLVVNGRECKRRVANLYMPGAAKYFGCRKCYRLTYESCQHSDKRVSLLRRDPDALSALIRDPYSASDLQLLLGLKALWKKQKRHRPERRQRSSAMTHDGSPLFRSHP